MSSPPLESSSPPPPAPGPRPGLLGGLAVLVALVFVAGLFIGQSGLLGRFIGAPTPSATPAAQAPTPTVAPGQTRGPDQTPGQPATPGPGQTPAPVGTPDPGQTPGPGQTPAGTPRHTTPPDAPADFALFWEAWQIIREHFVGRAELGELDLTYGAIDGLVEALGDTGHSVFLTPEEFAREQDSLQGTIVGIGVLLGESDSRPVIVSVVSGGPASRAGIRSGDELVAVDGQTVEDLDPGEIASLVRGEAGTTVEIRVYRPATDEFLDFSIVREEINFPAATWTMVPGTEIAVLRLIQFSQDSSAELRQVRDEAIAAGARGIILDLRSNPGGLVHEAVNSASLFVDDGSTVYVRELADGERISVATNPEFEPTDLPLVVLIDEGTASSAEILSGAIQDNGRGLLIGETTFGTGTVLITFPLSDGSAVRIAIERWLTPDGELIFERGITPGLEVSLEPPARPLEPDEIEDLDPTAVPTIDDVQLLRAIEELRQQGVP